MIATRVSVGGHIGPLLLSAALVCLAWTRTAPAQGADFQIVWVVVGEAEANSGNQPARAGRHLFMASDLMALALKEVKVARLEVAPAVTQLAIGKRLCVSSLSIMAYAPGGETLKNAPLSISVRQDQKQKLALVRDKTDICVTPAAAGEYPIRFASLLPAADGTTRGAQIFLRVSDAKTAHTDDANPAPAPTRLSGSLSTLPHSSVPQRQGQ